MARKAARKTKARSKATRAKAHARRSQHSGAKAARHSGRSGTGRIWSQRVTRESDALDLDRGIFSLDDPKKIAASLKRSAERSRRRKAAPYRSALSMLTFYINRAGRKLPAHRKRILNQAKDELGEQFGRD